MAADTTDARRLVAIAEYRNKLITQKELQGRARSDLWCSQQDLKDGVDKCYSTDTYRKCYAGSICGINSYQYWPFVEKSSLIPPPLRKKRGRPKTLRKRAPDEPPPGLGRKCKKMKDVRRVIKCKKCSEPGHNSRTCTFEREAARSTASPTPAANMDSSNNIERPAAATPTVDAAGRPLATCTAPFTESKAAIGLESISAATFPPPAAADQHLAPSISPMEAAFGQCHLSEEIEATIAPHDTDLEQYGEVTSAKFEIIIQ
ncbi:hypothetical protein M569_14250 [Genlisea aurea]|uniref:CCHC-type domain-containing protein n=1 Tax=Genlisea aurea TaxID=192259 RepID=S8DLS9_9LAMI|nr:hypothetical protein M569_14250 [Genlisea aurea]